MARTTIKELQAQIDELKKLIESTDKNTKKSAKKRAPKKTEEKPKKTREERLTEKYGDIDTRKKYIAVRNAVAAEMREEAEKTGNYWTKAQYKKELAARTTARWEEVNKG